MRCSVAATALAALLLPIALASCSSTRHNELTANGHILLTYEGANGDQTDYSGVLGENASHCITVGKFIVLAPTGSKVLDDGSVVVAGRTWKPDRDRTSAAPSCPPPQVIPRATRPERTIGRRRRPGHDMLRTLRPATQRSDRAEGLNPDRETSPPPAKIPLARQV